MKRSAEQNGEFIHFCRNVGIVAGATLAAGAIIAGISSFAWRTATRPIIESLAAERAARVEVDTLMMREIRSISRTQERIATALIYPAGSQERAVLLREVTRGDPGRNRSALTRR